MMSVSNLKLIYGDVAEGLGKKNQTTKKMTDAPCNCEEKRVKSWRGLPVKPKNKHSHIMAGAC